MGNYLRNYKSRAYKFNPQAFEDYKQKNREHQAQAFDVSCGNRIGQVISPCGTGKTRIQICIHVEGMIQAITLDEVGTFVIASHRLSLNRQLLNELVDVIIRCGIPFDILCIGSDVDDASKYYAKYKEFGYTPDVSRHLTTTSVKEVEDFVAQAHALNRHVLVVSTYHSIDRLKNVGPINIITHDEAQNVVQTNFSGNVQAVKFNAKREYYFTATRKTKGNDGGMNDAAFFGPVIVDVKPQCMIDKGEISTPRIHTTRGLHGETTDTGNLSMLCRSVIGGFVEHKKWVKSESISPDDVGAKIIVGYNGIDEMMDLYNNLSLRAFIIENHISLFAISSDGAYVNGDKVSPAEFFAQMHALKDGDDALIFHVDMLTEGIDLPSITGVMPLRDLGTIKLIQLIGRALRLHKMDRARIYSGELTPGDYKNYVKPFGHLILNEHLETLTDSESMKKIIKRIYAEYQTPIEDTIIGDKFIKKEPIDLDNIPDPDTSDGKQYALEHKNQDIISACLSDTLTDNISYMTPQQQIDYILSLLDSPNENATV